MGYSLNVVLTPYMEITKNPTALRVIKENINICTNTECRQHKNQKRYNCSFCPICGSQVGPFEKVSNVEDSVNIHDLMEEIGREDLFFYHPELDVYLPNYLKKHRVNSDDDNVTEIDLAAPQSAIEAICIDPLYKKFFLHLYAKGVEYVIKYGLITYNW